MTNFTFFFLSPFFESLSRAWSYCAGRNCVNGNNETNQLIAYLPPELSITSPIYWAQFMLDLADDLFMFQFGISSLNY